MTTVTEIMMPLHNRILQSHKNYILKYLIIWKTP